MTLIPSRIFPFLALPPELRMAVYKELLSSNMGTTLLLYHDQSGRSEKLDIHPSILQVSSQIHIEAVSVLYDHNNFEIDLSSTVVRHPPGSEFSGIRRDHHLLLFRYDTAPNNLPVKPKGRCVFAHSTPSGLIYPHCFQRLRQITLVTSHGAIWGPGFIDDCFSTTGDLVLEILRYLAKPAVPHGQCEKTFKVTTKLCVRRPKGKIFTMEDRNLVSSVSNDEGLRGEQKKKLNVLLRAVDKQRKVTVLEDLNI